MAEPKRWPARLDVLFARLDQAEISWMLLRPPFALAQPAGDIDLLVEPSARDEVRRVVLDAGWVPLPVAHDVHAIDYDHDSDRFLWLHVQSAVRLGASTVPARAFLDASVRDPLPRPADAWMFWTLLLHGVLDKSEIAERYREELQSLAATSDDAPAELAEVAETNGVEPRTAVALAAAGDWSALLGLGSGRHAPTRPFRDRLVGQLDHVAGLWTRRGISVAVIGPDGAGKTTLVNELQSSLPLPTRSIYMGLTGGRLPTADRLRVPGVVLVARLALLWTRYAVSLGHRARGRIVVFDRYLLDAAAPSGRPLRPLARLSRRIQGRACPKPNLVLFLDVPGSTLHERSQEYDAATLETWRRAYQDLARTTSSVMVLDAERPADDVKRDAKELIWSLYGDRWIPRARRRARVRSS